MDFWSSTLSSSIGAFVSVGGAYFIANWQLNRAQKDNNTLYYLRFNEAMIYINNFDNKVDDILHWTSGKERKFAREALSKNDFINLKENLEMAIKVMNPELADKEINEFAILLNQINQTAPLSIYKEMNGLFFWMGVIYNNLRKDCVNLVEDMPVSLDFGFFREIATNKALKQFSRKYKKLKRKLKI